MGRKVFCSLSQEAALFTSLQHIICSISQSQLFSLSYCHTHSATVYHSMPHLTRQLRTHAHVHSLCCCIVFSVYLFSFGCQLVFGSICQKINLPPVELCSPASLCCIVFYIPICTLNKHVMHMWGSFLSRKKMSCAFCNRRSSKGTSEDCVFVSFGCF